MHSIFSGQTLRIGGGRVCIQYKALLSTIAPSDQKRPIGGVYSECVEDTQTSISHTVEPED